MFNGIGALAVTSSLMQAAVDNVEPPTIVTTSIRSDFSLGVDQSVWAEPGTNPDFTSALGFGLLWNPLGFSTGSANGTAAANNGTNICGDFICDSRGKQVSVAPPEGRGIQPTNIEFDVLLAGQGVLDTAKMGESFLFGNRSGLNAADSLRIGWSWVRDGQYWRFRITGSWLDGVVPGGHINLWPPSLFPFKRP